MNRKILIALLLAWPACTQAQLGGLMKKVKDKVDQRVDQRVNSQIDKSLDKAEGKTPPAANTGSTAKTSTAQTEDAAPVTSFSKYDFIAGEQILYYDNFEQEAPAELPTGWNTSGTGEVVTLENFSGKWLRLHNPFLYLTSNAREFAENYTIEFDLILQLKNNGWMYPTFSCGLIATGTDAATDNAFLKEYGKYASMLATLYPAENQSSRVQLESMLDNKSYFKSDAKVFGQLEKFYGRPAHIAIQVQKERFRMWINESKVFDVPKGMPTSYKVNQLLFKVGQTNYKEEQYGVYISNIKAATGVPDTRHKLIEEGKFSTTAILFDVNAATLKPESGGVLREIAGVLGQYKDVKVKIIGYTDSDGSDAANLALSQKRAAAVKDALVNEYGIDASRIESDGKGESEPAGDNKTKEGKAANRRVEFIKQ